MPAENVWFPNVCTKCARHTRASLRPWLIIMIVIVSTGRQGLPLSWRVPTRHTDIRYDNLHATDSRIASNCINVPVLDMWMDVCTTSIWIEFKYIFWILFTHPVPKHLCRRPFAITAWPNQWMRMGAPIVYTKRVKSGTGVVSRWVPSLPFLTSCSTARKLVQGPQTTAMRWIPKILHSKWKIAVWEPCVCTHCDRCEAPWMSRHLKWYYYWYNSYRKPVKPTRTTNEEPKT